MHESSVIQAESRTEFYHQLTQLTESLVADESNFIANLSNVSALLNEHLQTINWVGFYIWHEESNELILGPFQGKPACIRIGKGRGVCGTAVASRKIQVVTDVNQFTGHLACDAASQSELVVPLFKGDRLVGVLDVDSPVVGRFDEADAQGLCEVARVLMEACEM